MKRFFLVFAILFSFTHYSQVQNSVLAEGTWYKFSVDTTGVFKLDRTFLSQLGVNVNTIDPRKIHIYGNGGTMLPELNSESRYEDLQENGIYIEGESDGTFDANDFILLYAKGPHDWNVEPNTGSASHQFNIFSEKSYYFLTINATDGKRIGTRIPPLVVSSNPITEFNDYTFFERDELSILGAGTQWFFNEDLNTVSSVSYSIPFDDLVPNSDVRIKVRGVSNSVVPTALNVNVNAADVFTLNFPQVNPDGLTKAFAIEQSGNIQTTSNAITVTLTYNNSGNPSAEAHLDYIEIQGKKNLIFTGKQFSFRNFEQANSPDNVEFTITNGVDAFDVWDVTNPITPQIITNQTFVTDFSFEDFGGSLKEYVVLSDEDFYTPTLEDNSRVANQNLHSLRDINYIVITNQELSQQAQRLVDYHQTNSNLTGQVVLIDQIYNEFASGSKDITGIRDFLKFLYDNNTSPDGKLQYVCFFGDSSYDYKDRIPSNNNIIPVKLSDNSFNLAFSYVTDDYYVMFDDNEGRMLPSDTIDVTSSRIPVSTIAQAKDVVDKILSYYNQESLGDWRNTITLLADDIDDLSKGDDLIQEGVEKIADDIKANKPVFNLSKIYMDAFVQQNSAGGERYPDVNKAITEAIEKGTLILDYFGHGGEDGFAQERILDKPQIQEFNNLKTLPLLITITCSFSRFDNPVRITAGELTFWNRNGGAASMITTTREVFISTGQNFNEQMLRILLGFNGEEYTIAESLKETKNQFTSFQKFFIYHFGDPAMKLAIPKPNVRITRVNDIEIANFSEGIKALSKVKIEGTIVDQNNNPLTDFNGILSTTIFDKPIDKTTLDNDSWGVTMPFDTQDSKIFRGKSSVENGAFSFEFIVPKDIKLALGKGKFSFYAFAANGVKDVAGFNSEITIGGINENAPEDNIGPEISLFMNDESFLDGGNTNSSPNLIAVLKDQSGINTSITAVDHDIVAILDGDTNNPIILNDFYQTELNDFTSGKVNYLLRNLEEGPHTLELKAWDTYNNSSEATLNFVVVNDANLNLENVLNYPNPFVNYTEFWFNHNKPNEPLEVQVQIFTVSGKLVKTINQQVQTTGNLSREITWNGLDDFGQKIGKGVYIYKLKVKSKISNIVSEKYEKLVILQ